MGGGYPRCFGGLGETGGVPSSSLSFWYFLECVFFLLYVYCESVIRDLWDTFPELYGAFIGETIPFFLKGTSEENWLVWSDWLGKRYQPQDGIWKLSEMGGEGSDDHQWMDSDQLTSGAKSWTKRKEAEGRGETGNILLLQLSLFSRGLGSPNLPMHISLLRCENFIHVYTFFRGVAVWLDGLKERGTEKI